MSSPNNHEIPRADAERDIRSECQAGHFDKAATILLETYGSEIFRFVLSRLRNHEGASEVFSQFTEDVWRGLGGFRWQCTSRVWAYTLARHATSRYIADARRRGVRETGLSKAGPLSELAEKIRTQTLMAARTEAKNQVAELRERLPLDEQTLIVLRITRKLDWKEIARVLIDTPEGSEPAERDLNQEAARLRKRFQLVKEKLRQMASEAGLVVDREDES
jgi:RNA polymerase sigma-70 factor (ECF subfamily)